MVIIKLDAIGSTNDYLKDLAQEKPLSDYTIVSTRNQTEGKGQRRNNWTSEAGKNLTISILKLNTTLKSEDQFRISIHVGLALIHTLDQYGIPDLALKWPNDIMSGQRKICGILIENKLRGQKIVHSVIGIGLNVNQESFPGLPNAVSMKQIIGEEVDLDTLLLEIRESLQREFKANEQQKWKLLRDRYENILFQAGNWVEFKEDGISLMGLLKGITQTGQLNITLEDGNMRSLSQGELQWLL